MAGGRLFGAFLDGQDGAKAVVSAPRGCKCHGAGAWQWHWRSVAGWWCRGKLNGTVVVTVVVNDGFYDAFHDNYSFHDG